MLKTRVYSWCGRCRVLFRRRFTPTNHVLEGASWRLEEPKCKLARRAWPSAPCRPQGSGASLRSELVLPLLVLLPSRQNELPEPTGHGRPPSHVN